MFIPRAVRLKGVKEIQRPKLKRPLAKGPSSKDELDSKAALVKAMGEASMGSPDLQQEQTYQEAPTRGPRFTTKPVTLEYIAQLAAGIELIFTDYAHQDKEGSKWLKDRYRVVGDENNYIHLTAILEHPNISRLKPEATQVLLKKALHDCPSSILELSHNEYHVRRRPSTNPLPFVPKNSFEIVDDDGLSFWDQRTIYVEPHLRSMCPTPARVSQWLTEHGQLKPKWLPVQAVHTLWNSCAFVVLSGNVTNEGMWNKWREAGKPDDWKVMTKLEHTKRTAEYLALLERENPKGMRKIKDTSQLPPIERPAVLPMSFKPLPEQTSGMAQGKRKRKRRKPAKHGEPMAEDEDKVQAQVNQEMANKPDAGMADAPEEAQPEATEPPTNKRKRKRRKSERPYDVDNGTIDAIATANDGEPSKKRRR